MSRRQWFSRVATFAACAFLVGLTLPSRSAPAPVVTRGKVEIVFVVDTTGSMGGWLEMFRNKYWAILSLYTNTRPAPEIKVGLVDYRDRGDSWITKVYDFRTDLDAVYTDVGNMKADQGGDTPESVNQALYDAVHKISWSKDSRALRVVYLIGDAPPHMDYPDDVKYPVTCREAQKRGIWINAIQCGTDNDCTKHWKEIASLSNGAFVQVQQVGNVKYFSSPHDARLQEIQRELLGTVLYWGPSSKRDADQARARVLTNLASNYAADRMAFYAREGRVAPFDLIDGMRSGSARLELIKADELPAELKGLTGKDRRDALDKVIRKRSALLREAADLDRKRTATLQSELSRTPDQLDAQLLDALRRQAKKYRMKY